MFTFNHCNLNITDPERSLAFYREALGLDVVRAKEREMAGPIFGWNSPGYGIIRNPTTWEKMKAICA